MVHWIALTILAWPSFSVLVESQKANDPLFDLNFAILLVTCKTLVINRHSVAYFHPYI
jgi:hypothetical protein